MGNRHSASATSTRTHSPSRRGSEDNARSYDSPRALGPRRSRLSKSESTEVHELPQSTSQAAQRNVPNADESSSQQFSGEPISPNTLAQHFSHLFSSSGASAPPSSSRHHNSNSSSSQSAATNLPDASRGASRPDQNAPDFSSFLNTLFGGAQSSHRPASSSTSRTRVFERNGALFAYVNGRVVQLQAPRKCPYCHKQINPFQEEYDLHVVKCMTKPRIKSVCFAVAETDTDLLEEDRECTICFEEYEIGQTCARLECFCVFHKACLDSWLSRKQCCPLHMKEED